MLDISLSPSATRTTAQLDLRPLHAALTRAGSVLDVLGICEATAMAHGGGLWIAACVEPCLRTYVAGAAPVSDAIVEATIEDMARTARHSSVGDDGFARCVAARWRNGRAEVTTFLPPEYAQVALSAADSHFGLLRVMRAPAERADGCDWEAVETVMCAANPHIVICLQRDARSNRIDPLTGLWTPAELAARTEIEVERSRVHPVELSLVVIELRMAPDRDSSVMTDAELRAIGEVLRGTLRASDSAARLPDGRFAILLPMTSQRSALIAGARVVDRLRAQPELSPDLEAQTGVSGWAFEGPSAPELFTQATQALENAKSAGARGAFIFL